MIDCTQVASYLQLGGEGGLILQSFPHTSIPASSLIYPALLVAEPTPEQIHFTSPAQTTPAVITQQGCIPALLIVAPALAGAALSHPSIAKKLAGQQRSSPEFAH